MGSSKSKTKTKFGYTIKIGLVGDAASGKSSIMERFLKNSCSSEYSHTVKNRSGIKSYILDEVPEPVTTEIWEVQDFNLHLNTVIIVIDCRSSIDQIQETYNRWTKICMDHGCLDIHIAINKIDLKRISKEHHDKILEALAANEYKMVFFVSALKNEGVDQMFKVVMSHWMRNLAI